MTTTETEEEIDLSDLDSLNDPEDHIICGLCYPRSTVEAGKLVLTLCGKRVILRFGGKPREVDDSTGPTCVECDTIFEVGVCRVCGGIP